MTFLTIFRSIIAGLSLSCCGPRPGAHRFTDVVETKPGPDRALVAALVWNEHGLGQPHLSAVVLAARGADLLDGEPVTIASEDFRPLDFHWTGPNALEVRLPCGAWSSLANYWQAPGTRRVVEVAFLPPAGCVALSSVAAKPKTTASAALPAGASQPSGIMFSP